jgi:predicted MFS family arabinose efflux permease
MPFVVVGASTLFTLVFLIPALRNVKTQHEPSSEGQGMIAILATPAVTVNFVCIALLMTILSFILTNYAEYLQTQVSGLKCWMENYK